jgi:lipopolysaccharide export system protein LptA
MIWLAALLLCARPAAADDGASHAGKAVVGGVVRSKEWVVRRAPHREEEFIGEVSYSKGSSLLNADWALYKQEPQIWQARGHVRLQRTLPSGGRDDASGDAGQFNEKSGLMDARGHLRLRRTLPSGELIDVAGETGQFNQKSGSGWLLGPKGEPVDYSRTPLEGAPDLGTAQRLEWEGQELIHFIGRVHVWGPRLELWGDKADYEASEQKLTATGSRPVVHVLNGALKGDWTGAVQGDTVVALQKPDRFQADGRTRGWIQFKDEPGKRKK